jgi:hypothetical protein
LTFRLKACPLEGFQFEANFMETLELRRERNGQFAIGTKAPNPGGRPRGAIAQIRQACREHCLDAAKTLVSIMQNPEARDRDRITAAAIILERGLGKPLPEDQLEQIEATAPQSNGARILAGIPEELRRKLLGAEAPGITNKE